ncbi:MAG: 4-(cytidine 5'-diphospho)-2-C-methyl-D-erythritol kinase [Planctomycetes bacterium]|nr:4-(cytidine 5'-diphospho)-2-C-methyl-D-erythritol kinase [Planctomycetota bacterium]MCC7173033.1 4-(cytidine 5'-diphospho)-2-C-methyl-D-erythritol kinase [Planctomycetota bacterium]
MVKILEHSRRRVVVSAPCKLNLWLEITGKRADGYHELFTIFHAIDLADRLTVVRTDGEGITLTTCGRPCPADPSNLVWKAAEALFSRTGRRFGLTVELEKRVPSGAGLGGGSSDAAAMLIAMNLLADARCSDAMLHECAAELGSDVPFFLLGGTALARGRGERLEAILPERAPHRWFVVVFPGVEAPTAKVYGAFSLDLKKPFPNEGYALTTIERLPSDGRFEATNDLAKPFFTLFPQVADLRERMQAETGRVFSVTGSGSAMFTTVEHRMAGLEVQRKLEAMQIADVFVCASEDAS